MAKTTKHGGGSSEYGAAVQHVLIRRPMLGGELPSVGINSETSSEETPKPKDSEKQHPLKPVLTTESPSEASEETIQEGVSTVPTTAGDGRTTPVRKSARPVTPKRTSRHSQPDDFEL